MDLDLNVPYWFAIYTSPHHEKRVAAHLAGFGIENYLPLYEAIRQWSDRRKRLQLPLFPGYLFVHTALRDRLPILQSPGFVRLVGPSGHPLPLDTKQIEALRNGLKQVAAEPYPHLPVGQRVRIVEGPLMGFEGVLLRRKSGLRVVVSLDSIQRSFVADLDQAVLEPIGPDHP